jgi:DNA-binding transcriptional MocR family regulator
VARKRPEAARERRVPARSPLPPPSRSASGHRLSRTDRIGRFEDRLLGLHLPAIAPDFEEALAETSRDAKSLLRGHGYTGLGLATLREAIAAHLTSTVSQRASEVMVTHGAQAIGLAAALILHPGDAIVLEDPTYLGAIDLLGAAGTRIVPIPIGATDCASSASPPRSSASTRRPISCRASRTRSAPSPGRGAHPRDRRARRKHGVVIVEDGTLDDLDADARRRRSAPSPARGPSSPSARSPSSSGRTPRGVASRAAERHRRRRDSR